MRNHAIIKKEDLMKNIIDFVEIRTADFYGRKDLWPYMDESIFVALESSFQAGRLVTKVRKDLFEKLIQESKRIKF